MSEDISRRNVLAGTGAGLGALVLGTGSTAARRSERHIVGTSTKVATEAAQQAADAVNRVLDFGAIGQAVAGVYPEAALENLRRRPDVRYVEPDGQYHAIDEARPWGIDRVGADVVHANGETGGDDDDGDGGADVAIIDTGIDDDHPDLTANVGTGKAFVKCKGPNCNYDWSDDNDHGTHCAGIADARDNTEGVIGVSTAATLHSVKVLDDDGSGYWSDIAAGIEWVADRGYEVGSMSLGGSSASSTVRDACEYAHEQGVLLVAAAGNDGPCGNCVSYPARYDAVMAISATSSDDSLARFSSTGPEIELAAPGQSIYSTVIGGYDTFSGTSMACPHVSGAGAQLMDNGYSNAEARRQLKETAEDIGLSDDEQGEGLLDVEAAMNESTDSAPTVSWTNPTDGDEVSGTVSIQIAASDAEDADGSLTVEYRVDGGDWRPTDYDSASGEYEDAWDSTEFSDGEHTLDARATDGDDDASTASVTVVTENTDDGDTASAPSIDSYDVSEAGSPNPHAEITAEWDVGDDDADLDTVVIEVINADTEEVAASRTHDVSGADADGTDTFEIKHARNETFRVTLSVTDAADHTTSADPQTVTE